jgi:hypothetical protein
VERHRRATRARARRGPALPANARVGERAVFCDLVDGDAVDDASGRRTALLVEADPSGARCAAFWPREAGWHALVRGSDRSPFFVRAADAATRSRVRATPARRALLGAVADTLQETQTPRSRWPFFLAFLAMITLLWLMERARR